MSRWIILSVLFTLQSLASLGTMSVPPLAPFIKADWNLGETQVGLFAAALYGGTALTSLPAGQFTDRLGPRRVLGWGQLLVGLLIFALAWMPHLHPALFCMFLAGIGYSTLTPATTKAIMYLFPVHLRSTAVSLKQMGVPAGSSLAAALLPSLALASSWRHGIALAATAIIIPGLMFYLLYRDPPEMHPEETGTAGHYHDLHQVFHNKDIIAMSFFILIMMGVQLSLGTFLALYLVEKIGYSKVVAGGYLPLAQVAAAVGRPAWGVISNTLFHGKRKPVLYLCAGLAMLMVFSLAFTCRTTPGWCLAIIAILFGFSANGHNGVAVTLVAELGGKEMAGAALGSSSTICHLGVVFGTPLFGYLAESSGSYLTAWLFLTLILALALVLLALVKENARA